VPGSGACCKCLAMLRKKARARFVARARGPDEQGGSRLFCGTARDEPQGLAAVSRIAALASRRCPTAGRTASAARAKHRRKRRRPLALATGRTCSL
jgi:hypothetical protein